MNRHERRREKTLQNKEQHYVAKGYTKAWRDPATPQGAYVWLFDRDGQHLGRRGAPKSIFTEAEMYTAADSGGGRDLALEHGLGRIENDFCAVRRGFIEPKKPMGERERAIICAFAGATQFRTPGYREHMREQWGGILDKMQRMDEQMRNATPEERARAARRPPSLARVGADANRGMDMEEVEALVANPLQMTMPALVNGLAPMLMKLRMSILCTETTPGFITSDQPSIWFDPEGYKRPPMFQGQRSCTRRWRSRCRSRQRG